MRACNEPLGPDDRPADGGEAGDILLWIVSMMLGRSVWILIDPPCVGRLRALAGTCPCSSSSDSYGMMRTTMMPWIGRGLSREPTRHVPGTMRHVP